jgi:hypothetical protein
MSLTDRPPIPFKSPIEIVGPSVKRFQRLSTPSETPKEPPSGGPPSGPPSGRGALPPDAGPSHTGGKPERFLKAFETAQRLVLVRDPATVGSNGYDLY